MSKTALLVVNFGGPRNLEEVPDFLKALLTDCDVIRTPLPSFLQQFFFRKIAKRRAPKVAKDYAKIGGKSPIFADTEWMATNLSELLNMPTLAFHRYLKATHEEFFHSLHEMQEDRILVFPLFPQFSYVTTGSIARYFSKYVKKETIQKMHWITSYATNDYYIEAFCRLIREFLQINGLEEVTLFFSAHGLPVKYVREGDPYQKECEDSFKAIAKAFPEHSHILAYQSKFGRGEWLRPSTLEICTNPELFLDPKKPVVFIPLSFSSDHIETLFEVEEEYIKPLQDLGFSAYRCPALGRRKDWVEAVGKIIEESKSVQNQTLIRPSRRIF